MAASDITMPDGKYLADIVANLNVFASDPATSRGAGEIIYQSTAGILKVNTGTAGSPVWVTVGAGGSFLPLAGGTLTGDLTISKSAAAMNIKSTSAIGALNFLDTSDNLKGYAYKGNDDFVVGCEDGDLYLTTTITTGGSVIVGTVAIARLTVADALIMAHVPLVVPDHGAAATDEVVNVCYGTSATPPTASTVTEGCLYIQYTA